MLPLLWDKQEKQLGQRLQHGRCHKNKRHSCLLGVWGEQVWEFKDPRETEEEAKIQDKSPHHRRKPGLMQGQHGWAEH